MTAAFLDPALDVLRAQLRALHPGITIYWIGDTSHQARPSDHNPEADGSVDAIDVMVRAPFGQAAAERLVQTLVNEADGRLSYIIWRRRIWHPGGLGWAPYNGSDPHNDHVHISRNDVNESSRAPWVLAPRKASTMRFTVTVAVLRQGDDDATQPGPNLITRIQAIVGAKRDGEWGKLTTDAIAAMCKLPASECDVLTESLYRKIFGV